MSDYKFYDLGVVCGRFGHEHLGHITLFNNSISLCKKTLILVGSAQESGTLRNPFKLETRINVIKETYPEISEDVLIIKGLNDLTNEYDITHDWGKFVKSQVELHMNRFADLIISGDDESRSHWFSPKDIEGTAELIIPRSTIPISATVVRGLLTIDDQSAWQKTTHPFIHNMYEQLRNELMSVPCYKEIYDSIRKIDLSLDNFISTYKILEEKDKNEKMKFCNK